MSLIDDYAFHNTSISRILIPSYVKKLGKKTFGKCRELEKIEFQNDSKLSSFGENCFSKTNISSISIPSNIDTFQFQIFKKCPKLKIIEINSNKIIHYMFSAHVIVMIPAELKETLEIYKSE